MILLDTNVVSEVLDPESNPIVLAWFNGHKLSNLYLSAVGAAEMWRGVTTMPRGKKREWLAAKVRNLVRNDFDGRVLHFDRRAAFMYGDIWADRKAQGRPISVIDCMIAATANVRGAAVATRNVSDFEGCGVEIINPWEFKVRRRSF